MISEILREVATLEDIEDGTSEKVLIWVQRMEAQRAQKLVLDNIKEAKEFDTKRYSVQRHANEAPKTQKGGKLQKLCNRACAETVPSIQQEVQRVGKT